MKLLFAVLIVGIVIGSIFILFLPKQEKKQISLRQQSEETEKKETEVVATFMIFTNGTRRIFTDPKYHNQSQEVYLQAENPHKVFVKAEKITWGDFFHTLPKPMQLTPDCLTTGTGQIFCTSATERLKFYLNGEEDPEVLEKEIGENDKLLISYGQESEAEIQKQLEQLSQQSQ